MDEIQKLVQAIQDLEDSLYILFDKDGKGINKKVERDMAWTETLRGK